MWWGVYGLNACYRALRDGSEGNVESIPAGMVIAMINLVESLPCARRVHVDKLGFKYIIDVNVVCGCDRDEINLPKRLINVYSKS